MYEPGAHFRAGEIIRRHSSNKTDIYAVAAEFVPWAKARRILDLGCGYGAQYGPLKGALHPELEIAGIDANPTNQGHFLRRVEATGATGRFEVRELPGPLPYPDDHFDAALAIFSLYFFVDMLPEIARVLRPGGSFVTVTHSCHSLAEINRLVADVRLLDPLGRFNAENGLALLAPHFAQVDEVPYPNQLSFDRETIDDLIFYLEFKRPPWMNDERAEEANARVRALAQDGPVVLCKDDIVYWCRK